MRKGFKKVCTIFTAAVLACGALSFAACGTKYSARVEGGPSAEETVASNGGFVVQKGAWLYFINGVENYTANNKYGKPVKGSLMRILKADAEAGVNSAETVIPSIMYEGSYSAGIFIYGDRIYYATPNSDRDTSGAVTNDYLDFKSAKLDGSDVKTYFYVSNNSTNYRYVTNGEDDTVYLVYSENSELISYNTATKTKTVLASDVKSFVFDSTNKENPWIYYIMGVTNEAQSQNGENVLNYNYTQIYRVRADATEAPYEYSWTDKFLEATDGEEPYHNLGEIVLDGIGQLANKQQYNHSDSTPNIPTEGYTYTLRSYTNGGLYFVRNLYGDSSFDGRLYYLDENKLGTAWDSIAGNSYGTDGSLDVVANATNAGNKATASAIYYLTGEGATLAHHYLYVSGSEIRRADVATDGTGTIAEDIAIAYNVSGASLQFIDSTSHETYKYVYFTRSNGSGRSIERAVYNGTKDDYHENPFEDQDLEYYKSVKLLNVQHASGWYNFELIDGTVYFADAASVGNSSYNYIKLVSLKEDGKLMDNKQIAALNEKYEKITEFISNLTSDYGSNLADAIKYYFYTGETENFYLNIEEAVENEQSETHLYSEEEQAAFKAFYENKGFETSEEKTLFEEGDFVDEDGKYYRTISYFVSEIGEVTEADAEAMNTSWRNSLRRYAVTDKEETGLAAWKWALIGVAIGIVVAGAAVACTLIVLKRKNANKAVDKGARMHVDTTDDREVDVYAEDPAPQPVNELEEAPEQPAEQPAEEANGEPEAE